MKTPLKTAVPTRKCLVVAQVVATAPWKHPHQQSVVCCVSPTTPMAAWLRSMLVAPQPWWRYLVTGDRHIVAGHPPRGTRRDHTKSGYISVCPKSVMAIQANGSTLVKVSTPCGLNTSKRKSTHRDALCFVCSWILSDSTDVQMRRSFAAKGNSTNSYVIRLV